MSADFLSGLVLVAVVLGGAAYLVKAFFWESIVELVSARRAAPPPGANDHLVGARGRVVDDGSRDGSVRVRVGMESWRARAKDGRTTLPLGTEVDVAAVDGSVLEVVERTPAPETTGA